MSLLVPQSISVMAILVNIGIIAVASARKTAQ